MARILVVDDNEQNVDLLSRRLQRKGFDTAAAYGGDEALKLLDEEAFDLVLLDVMMPGVSGLDVLRNIRDSRSKLELPVIMATARSDSADVVEALTLGANDYVTKPLDFPIVLARIEAQLMMKGSYDDAMRERPSAAPSQDPSSGDEIGPGSVLQERYELEDALGEGGFAVVYRARQLTTGQRVAVKLLYRAFDQTTRARFQREMEVIARINHPHVIRLVDSGQVSGRIRRPSARAPEPQSEMPFLVMEYLEGEPLESLLQREGPLDVVDAVDLMLPVISAVAKAHSEAVIHRDIKPANIFVERGPGSTLRPVVLDFGIAKPQTEEADDTRLTQTANFVGTPHYMAPEQAFGNQLDPRADQYSIGVVLYEVLTGRTPYADAQGMAQLVHRLITGGYPKPRDVNPRLPESLERIVLRAMSTQPENRFPCIEDLGGELLQFASEGVRDHHSRALSSSRGSWSAATSSVPVSHAPTLLYSQPKSDDFESGLRPKEGTTVSDKVDPTLQSKREDKSDDNGGNGGPSSAAGG